MEDIVKIRIPVEIVHGILDPLVIAPNLSTVAAQNKKIRVHAIPAGHEVRGAYEVPLVKVVQKTIESLR